MNYSATEERGSEGGSAVASEFEGQEVSWGSFEITGPDGKGYIQLAQRGRKNFALGSTITYRGETGLEDFDDVPAESVEAIRTVTPEQSQDTDLASVPWILMWFVSPYGVHTPAALVHDRLIGLQPPLPGITDQNADRFFRFMLKDLGVRFIRRWLMWTATAFRTRWLGGSKLRWSLIAWVIFAVAGIVVAAVSAATGNWLLVLLAALAPIPASALWGKQFGAGLVAAYFAVPWVLPPTVFALAFYVLYWVAEKVFSRVFPDRLAGSEPLDYKNF